MQLVEFNPKLSEKFVYVAFKSKISKLYAIESFETSFSRIGGIYCPELSGTLGSVWKFPQFVTSDILQEIIHNTCFECGGLMKDSAALVNTWVSYDDFGNDAWQHGSTMSRTGHPVLKKVRKCISCGHSHT